MIIKHGDFCTYTPTCDRCKELAGMYRRSNDNDELSAMYAQRHWWLLCSMCYEQAKKELKTA